MTKYFPAIIVVFNGFMFLLLFYTAVLITHHQLINTQMLKEDRVSIDSYVDGTASRPFAYRVLIPKILRAITAVTPPQAANVLDRWGKEITKSREFHGFALFSAESGIPSGPENKYPQAIFLLAVLQFACLVGYGLIGSSLYASLFPSTSFRAIAAPMLLMLVYPIITFGVGHIYDFSVLLLNASLLLAMSYRRHALYLILFTVACFNKETTLLIVLAYAAVLYRRLPFPAYAFMLAAQLAIFLAIYISTRVIFSGNAGKAMEIWLFHQAGWYWHRPLIFFLVASAVVFIVSFRWNEKPAFLRRSMMVVPVHLALFLYAAFPGEWRNFYEIVPILSMFVLRNVEFMCGQWRAPSTLASAG